MISNGDTRMSGSQAAKDFVGKIYDLKIVLSRDLLAMDAKWTLFVSAALSYRYDSQLKPFPPKFATEQGCNIEALVSVINEVPALKIILNYIIEENYDELDTEIIDLLHWVLVSGKNSALRSVSNEEFDIILSKIPQKNTKITPSHVFEVLSPINCKAEEAFEEQSKKFKSQFAFHGSKLDSFHSILQHGLHQHMCKNGYFGEGIYLSTALAVSLNYSPNGAAWGASQCGSMISCVAVCEYVEDPEHVKFYEKENKNNDIPKSYLVITNNDILRLRYLLFYAVKSNTNTPTNMALAWINQNKYMLTICCYTLFLASIGIANSGNGIYFRNVISKKSSDVINLLKHWLTNDN